MHVSKTQMNKKEEKNFCNSSPLFLLICHNRSASNNSPPVPPAASPFCFRSTISHRPQDSPPDDSAQLLGFVAYGLSIYYYVHAQRLLGAARTSAYYAVAPFIGAFLSLIIFREVPGVLFLAALALMAVGAWLSSGD